MVESINLFGMLCLKLMPLYVMILLGFISAKKLRVQSESISRVILYIINPIVMLYGALVVEITPGLLTLPLVIFLVASIIAFTFLKVGALLWQQAALKNMLSFCSGLGNAGTFGIPLIVLLLDERAFGVAVVANMGFALFENTVGLFITSLGRCSIKQAMMALLRLPTIYAFLFGLILNACDVVFPAVLQQGVDSVKGAYTLLGMMIIGMGLSTFRMQSLDRTFIGLAFTAKFMIWPSLMLLIVILDQYITHFYSPLVHNVMLILAIVPMAGNTVSWATELKLSPDKVSVSVFLSTLFALFYIPLMANAFLNFDAHNWLAR